MIEELKKSLPEMTIKENEMMKNHTSFNIGGPARYFAEPENTDELTALIKFVKKENIRFFILGNGSNILFCDKGFDGMVISTGKLKKLLLDGEYIIAGAGVTLNKCCQFAQENSLSGMENLYGIPGSVGGAVYMNGGAFGSSMESIVYETKYLDLGDCTVKTISKEEHQYGYRKSIFMSGNFVILETKLKLVPGDGDLISEQMKTVLNKRLSTQPLNYPSAGSVFKRHEGMYTGKIIEEMGLKGYRIGGAMISEKHAGFIVNYDNASAEDVLDLIGYINDKIYSKFGFRLETEVIYIC